jgi:nucleotide-binding universal stress UspA family protein
MIEPNPKPIVVAVGDDSIDAALVFAAGEATRAGCGIHLLHVVHLFVQGPDPVFIEVTEQEQMGRESLNAALKRARDLAGPDTELSSDLVLGRVVPTIVDEAKDARMIVLEHRDLSTVRRLVTRSVAGGVAAHARVPVVSVPSTYSPEAAARTQSAPPVAVGVDVPEQSAHLLRAAGVEARNRGVPLHVLHTWAFPSAYDDIVMSRTEEHDWEARSTSEIEAVLDSLGRDLDGVQVRIDARHARPADALVEASKSSQLVVVGRHDPVMPVGSHVGPVARALLQQSACPVLLVDFPSE